MKVKRIESRCDLETYQLLTEKHLGVRYPLSYLLRSRVCVAYNERGEMIGGYLLQKNRSEIRVLKSLPESPPKNWTRIVELSGLWFIPSSGEFDRRWIFWLHICKDFLPFVHAKMVFSYSTNKVSLAKMYSIVDPEILYSGIVPALPGMTEADHETICVASAWKMAFLGVRSPSFFVKRMFPRKPANHFPKSRPGAH